MSTEFRSPTAFERELAKRLLEVQFVGRNEILLQLDDAMVRTIEEYDDDYGSIEFKSYSGARPPLKHFVVEAIAADEDEVPILALLHIHDGAIRELEIVKADGEKIVKMPAPSAFRPHRA